MRLQKFILSLLSIVLFANVGRSQVITTIPQFATENDSIVVIFDATAGDGGLAGYTGDIYAHTGVLTDQSGSTGWRYVIADWGVNLPKAKLTNLGPDRWQLTIGKVHEYYGVPQNQKIYQLAFVFRNSDGSRTGRDANGADIFLPLFESGLSLVFIEPEISIPFGDPARTPLFINNKDTLKLRTTAAAVGTKLASLRLFGDKQILAEAPSDTLAYDFIGAALDAGMHQFSLVAHDTAGLADSTAFLVMVNPAPRSLRYPSGTVDGINVNDNSSVTLSLFAPKKEFVYVLGDFNDWKVDTTYFMNRYIVSPDSVRFWLTIDGLDASTEYAYQYLVDGTLRTADPYTEKILDPWNDQYIPAKTYPNLKPYPHGKTAEIVSTFQIEQDEYQWDTENLFLRLPQEDLVIYELLVRDFVGARNYQTLIDTLDYLSKLGVNAIELMPVNEFEGNDSWGYNPMYYFAPDKYYGTKNDLKRFIDACHQRGMAVILDMVLNHSTGQSPFVRLYANGNYGPPSADNPWFNTSSPNPVFSFFEDMDHESEATQIFTDRVNAFWLQEYRIDGYRFDFTKGMTNTPGDGGGYDGARIAILKRMADQIRTVDPYAYIILEHFADNREEIELSDYGMLLWGNSNYNYNEATMGYHDGGKSDFSWGYYGTRGWRQPNLVTYMESHDEERLMFKNLQYGNGAGSYSVKTLDTALDRIQLAASFFLTLPGPKMIWQFGELGYDISIDNPCRVCQKPILWNYYQVPTRNKLYRTFQALLKLRRENEVFRSAGTEVDLWLNHPGGLKRIRLNHPSTQVSIIGNFGVAAANISAEFYNRGNWFEFFSGDSISVTDPGMVFNLGPGEFRIFTNKRLERPDSDLITAVEELASELPDAFHLHQNYPNPFNPSTVIKYQLPLNSHVKIAIYDLMGRRVRELLAKEMPAGQHSIAWDGRDDYGRELASGIFMARMQTGQFVETRKLVKVK